MSERTVEILIWLGEVVVLFAFCLLVMAGCTNDDTTCTVPGATPDMTCTVPGATPDMTCTKTTTGCSCELSREAFMAQQRRRACQYRMVGMKLEPSVEKDLKEHPEACEGEGYSGEWTSGACLDMMAKGKCPNPNDSLICTSNGPLCLIIGGENNGR